MTSDFKCPFCGKPLWHPIGKPTWSCQNWDCLASDNMIGNHTIWEKLIQSQKDLEIARQALEFVKTLNERQDGCFEEDYETQMRTVYKALEQIEHKE